MKKTSSDFEDVSQNEDMFELKKRLYLRRRELLKESRLRVE